MDFVGNFIRFPSVKNIQDRLTFDKVTAKTKVAPFMARGVQTLTGFCNIWHTVY